VKREEFTGIINNALESFELKKQNRELIENCRQLIINFKGRMKKSKNSNCSWKLRISI